MQKTVRFVQSTLNLQAGEARPVGLLSALYAALVLAFIFLLATTFGLFIAEYGSQNLPYAYLTIAGLGALVAYIYLRLSERISLDRLVALNLGFTLVMFLLYRLGLASPYERTVIFLLPLWFQTMINLANLAVWPLAGSMFDLRQAKRLFGVIGIGNWAVNIIGGLIVAPVIAWIGLPDLLWVSTGWVVVAGIILALILKDRKSAAAKAANATTLALHPAVRPAARPTRAISPLNNPYVRQILAYVVLWWISFYFIDNIFFDRAAVQFADGAALAGFIGQLISVTGIVALITTTFLTGRILGRFGLRAGLLVMPILVTILLSAMGILGTFAPGHSLIFWIAAATKLVSQALGFSLSQTALTLLYQPLGAQRGKVQTLAEGIFQPIAIGISGLFLLLFNTYLRIDAIGLSYIFVPLAAAWLVSIFSLNRRYPLALAEALSRRRLGEQTLDVSDPQSRMILRSSLAEPDAGAALYALRMLEATGPEVFAQELLEDLDRLLAHPSREVRVAALSAVDRLSANAGEAVARHLSRTQDPHERAATVRALSRCPDAPNHPLLLAALDDPAPAVRQAALTNLLREGEGHPAAHAALTSLVHSPSSEDRLLAARVLDSLSAPSVASDLLHLLTDDNPTVRRAALLAAPGISGRQIWQTVAENADRPETARTVQRILASGGPNAAEAVRARLAEGALPEIAFRTLVQAAGELGGADMVTALQAHLHHTDLEGRGTVFTALRKAGFHLAQGESVDTLFMAEIRAAAVAAHGLVLFQETTHSLLQQALESEHDRIRRRTLDLLSFSTDSAALDAARPVLLGEKPQGLAYALEILDTCVPANRKAHVLPMFEGLGSEQLLAAWSSLRLTEKDWTEPEWLRDVLEDQTALKPSAWTRACLLHTAGSMQIRECADAAAADFQAAENIVRDMAAWAFSRIRTRHKEEGVSMLSTIEKVLILNTTDIFRRIPDHIIGEISTMLEEVHLEEGEPVFHKGDPGDSMYIIVEGEVRVMDGERLINRLSSREVFGEMALLDPEPRMGSVIADRPTHLLRLDQAGFMELLQESPEFARGIIRMLTYRLRNLTRALDGAHPQEP